MNKKILSLIHNDFEDLEFWYPILRLQENGYTTDVAGEYVGDYKGKYGVHACANITYDDVNTNEYDALLIPGGWAPDKMRRFETVSKIVNEFNDANKPIGTICHAGWVLVSARVSKGRILTSTAGIKDDIMNSGAKWVDQAVVVDKNFISARKPQDLPEYMKAFIKVLG